MTLLLVLKLTLVPALIAAVTWAGRRWGAGVAGWLGAFPVVSAPILWFVALEQGPVFAAQAAQGTLSAVLAMLVFCLVYAWAALRLAWAGALLLGLAAWFGAVALLQAWAPPLAAAGVAVLLALALAPRAYPTPPAAAPPAAGQPGSDLAWRMAAGAALVLGVTHFSASMGPQLSGLFAMFPVIASVLAVFSHRQSGAGFVVRLLRGMVLGYYAFAAFCAVLALALPALGRGLAFVLALGTALAVQGASRRFLPPRPAAAPGPASAPAPAPTGP